VAIVPVGPSVRLEEAEPGVKMVSADVAPLAPAPLAPSVKVGDANEHEAPAGNPEQVRATGLENAPVAVEFKVTRYVAGVPA